jgi:hypothetical protein
LAIGDSGKVALETERGDGAQFDWSAFADQLDVCVCPDGRLLADHLETSLAIEALATRGRERLSLIHRTDRSVQYAPSIAYRARREDRKARGQHEPGGQSKAERFIRTLEQEEAAAKTYVDLEDARRQTGPFYEEIYNIERLRSALSHKLSVQDFSEK